MSQNKKARLFPAVLLSFQHLSIATDRIPASICRVGVTFARTPHWPEESDLTVDDQEEAVGKAVHTQWMIEERSRKGQIKCVSQTRMCVQVCHVIYVFGWKEQRKGQRKGQWKAGWKEQRKGQWKAAH